MNLQVHSTENKGINGKEVIWIDVLANCDLSFYLVCDTTYTNGNHISNELRHMYWFPPENVSKGDWIALYTGNGVNSKVNNKRGTVTHIIHWELGKTILNKEGDCVVLFNLSTWNTTKA